MTKGIHYIILLIVWSCSSIQSQDYFLRKADFVEGVSIGLSMQYNNNRIFVVSGKIVENRECTMLAEISLEGNTLWSYRISEIDPGLKSISINNDTISLAGNSSDSDGAFRIMQFDLSGNRLGPIVDIADDNEPFTSMFHQNTLHFANSILVSGRGIQNDSMSGLIYVLHPANFAIDTLLQLHPQDQVSKIWDVEQTENGELLTFHEIEKDAGLVDSVYRVINKLNQEFEITWSYRSEVSEEWQNPFYGTSMEDGRIAMETYRPNSTYLANSIRVISQDQSIDWQYDSPFGINGYETMVNLKQLDNGDLLAMGRFSELDSLAVKGTTPYLYRISSDGEVLWRRRYYQVNNEGLNSIDGFIRDIIEFENGDIMGIGQMKFNGLTNETFIFKVDANGCIDPDNCGDVQLITHTEEINNTSAQSVILYPNPAIDRLHVLVPQHTTPPTKITILDMQGRAVYQSLATSTQEYSISDLTPGMYNAVLQFDTYAVTSRFIKI